MRATESFEKMSITTQSGSSPSGVQLLQRLTASPDVVVLPGHVLIRASADIAPADVKVSLVVGRRTLRPPGVLTTRHVIKATRAAWLVLKFDFTQYVTAPLARLQIFAAGSLIHDLPLVEHEGLITGWLDGVVDGHLVGWAAHLLGGRLERMSLEVDDQPERPVAWSSAEHAYSKLVADLGTVGFKVKLPQEALDGALHRLRLRVNDTWLPDVRWTADGGSVALPGHTDEGRGASYVFDDVFYTMSYADVANEAVKNDTFDASEHFWTCGIDEGRQPSLFFDIEYVQHRLCRLADARLSRREAVEYFFSIPPAERFVPNRWFSAHVVRLRHNGLVASDLSDFETFEYYVANAGSLALSPSGLFDEAAYCDRYPDVADAVQSGAFRSGFHHFMLLGWRVGRTNLPLFGEGVFAPENRGREERDTLFYRAGELRPVTGWFSETFYLDIYPDVRELKRHDKIRSGLDHFRALGCKEGRVPHPALLTLVQRAGDDIALFDSALTATPPDFLSPVLSVEAAAALYGYLTRGASHDERLTAANVIWPMVAQPWVGGTFKAERYLAANPDLTKAYGHDRGRAVEHWRGHGLREGRLAPGSNVFADRRFDIKDLLGGGSGVNLFGPVSLPNGLGVACRGYIRGLRQCGVEVDVYDASGLLCPGALVDIVGAELLRHSINLVFLNPDQVIPMVARYGTAIFDHRVNVGFWVWELPSARPEWRSALAGFDLIVTPSKFCTDAFAGETDAPVVTLPYVVDRDDIGAQLALYRQHAAVDRVVRAKVAGQKVVLFIMDASSYMARKGVDVFLRVVRLAEAAHPGRFLFVLKTHARDMDVSRLLADDVPDGVLFIDEILGRPDLYRLKQVADVYFSPHRSEGFGLNIFESLVMGVPVICSPFGGGPDALPADYPLFLDGRLTEVGTDIGPYRSSAIWFEPDADAALERLLAFFQDQRDHAGYARRLGDRLASTLSLKAIGEALSGILSRRCGLGLDLHRLATLFERPRTECFDIDIDKALSDGSHSVSAMLTACIAPQFSVITPTCNSDPAWLNDIYADLCAQTLQAWEWCVYDDGSTNPATLAALGELRLHDARVKVAFGGKNGGISHATNQAVRISSGQYVVMVDHDDRIDPALLASYARAIGEGRRPDVLYCDEDKLLSDGTRRDHYLKPDWSPEHILSTMYVLHCLCVRKTTFLVLDGYRAAFNGAQDHDFLLRAASHGAVIRHVDEVLYHWRVTHGSVAMSVAAKPYAAEAGRRAVLEHLQRIGVDGAVESGPIPGTYRVRPRLPADRVTLNVLTSATRRHGRTDAYVDGLVRSILDHHTDVDWELRLIVDTPAIDACAPLARLDPRITIVPYDRGANAFNFSDKANFAVRSTATERIVLLNDDMEAMNGEWLAALLEPLQLPGVGIVGGRLLYANDTVQHAGIVLGVNGSASHVFVGNAADHIGYNAFTHVMRNYSAVTGAMMAFRRSVFERVDGFDPKFPVDFNDTDFCLRVLETGRRIVFTPFAQMRHFESRSAVRLAADSHDEYRFCRKWRRYIDRDPHYNRNLRRDSTTFEALAYA